MSGSLSSRSHDYSLDFVEESFGFKRSPQVMFDSTRFLNLKDPDFEKAKEGIVSLSHYESENSDNFYIGLIKDERGYTPFKITEVGGVFNFKTFDNSSLGYRHDLHSVVNFLQDLDREAEFLGYDFKSGVIYKDPTLEAYQANYKNFSRFFDKNLDFLNKCGSFGISFDFRRNQNDFYLVASYKGDHGEPILMPLNLSLPDKTPSVRNSLNLFLSEIGEVVKKEEISRMADLQDLMAQGRKREKDGLSLFFKNVKDFLGLSPQVKDQAEDIKKDGLDFESAYKVDFVPDKDLHNLKNFILIDSLNVDRNTPEFEKITDFFGYLSLNGCQFFSADQNFDFKKYGISQENIVSVKSLENFSQNLSGPASLVFEKTFSSFLEKSLTPQGVLRDPFLTPDFNKNFCLATSLMDMRKEGCFLSLSSSLRALRSPLLAPAISRCKADLRQFTLSKDYLTRGLGFAAPFLLKRLEDPIHVDSRKSQKLRSSFRDGIPERF